MYQIDDINFIHFPGLDNPGPSLFEAEEQFFLNPKRPKTRSAHILSEDQLKKYKQEMDAASQRLDRFAPFFVKAYPETQRSQGLIESELIELEKLRQTFNQNSAFKLDGKLLLKLDSDLPISGSIKARGGIYNVLYIAEELLRTEGLLSNMSDYSELLEKKYRDFFSQYKIVVSSTGNLGLSIGISAAKFGFDVYVYMSQDARAWKKNLLKELGANVVEVSGDYGLAVDLGRQFAKQQPKSFFVDDERSEELFWGYSVAAKRLEKQLEALRIPVDSDHPLFVYLPCGVGGGPGGIATGLEIIYGDSVHCFFGEPTQVPCALLGFASELYDEIATDEIGLVNKTIADGLAVARLSPLVASRCQSLLAGCYTVEDERNFHMLKLLWEKENIFMEPSSQVALLGPYLFQKSKAYEFYLDRLNLKTKEANITHLAWGTGGSMVPQEERKNFINLGQNDLTFV